MNSDNPNQAGSQFGKNLTREELSARRTAAPGRLDDFDRDALEGWEKAASGMEIMRRADRRFLGRSRAPFVIGGGLLLLLIAVLLLVPGRKEQRQVAVSPPVTVDKRDVVIEKDIEKLQELPAEMQIRPQQVVSNFKGKQQQKEDKQAAAEPGQPEEEQFILPLKKIQWYSNKPKLTIDRKWAKEVYLSDLKLVDYRSYRTRQEIPSEQMTMTGTPASQEQIGIRTDDQDWKAIDIPYHDYISQTMEQFKAGNFKQALNRTNFILKFYPDDINALFYGGLCYYNLNQADQAIVAFQRVISNPFSNFDEEALWYLANAYDLKNDKAKARELFQEIVLQKGYYAKQAEKNLRK